MTNQTIEGKCQFCKEFSPIFGCLVIDYLKQVFDDYSINPLAPHSAPAAPLDECYYFAKIAKAASIARRLSRVVDFPIDLC